MAGGDAHPGHGRVQYRHNIGEYLEIHGPVDVALFEAALRRVAAETDSPRAVIVDDGNGPRQVLRTPTNWPLAVIDIRALPDPRAAVEAWMQADLARPADLARGPLFGHALFRVCPDHALWYSRGHHMAIDGFGGALVAQRTAQVYTALAKGRAPEPSPFGSLSALLAADQDYRVSAAFACDRAYWLERFADRPEPVSLATRSASVGKPAAVGAILRQRAHMPEAASMALRALAPRAGAGLPELLVALTALYLHRVTGHRDLVLGLPVTARVGRALRHIPGMVSNVVPLRLSMAPNMRLENLLREAGRELRQALRHQRCRGEDIRRDLGLVRGRQLYEPSVNIMPFDYELRFAGYAVTSHNLANGPAADLNVYIYNRGADKALEIGFNANPALYGAEDLTVHYARLVRLLEAVAANPGQPIGMIDMLSPDERRQLLPEWNAATQPVRDATLPALFEAQVARTPDATALVFKDGGSTYAALTPGPTGWRTT